MRIDLWNPVWAAATALAALTANPAHAAAPQYDAGNCAALYSVWAGPKLDDPQFLAMVDRGIEDRNFVKTIRSGAVTEVVRMTRAEAAREAQSRWRGYFMGQFTERDGADTVLSESYGEAVWQCMFTHGIRAPQAWVESQFDDPQSRAEFEQSWRNHGKDAQLAEKRGEASASLDRMDAQLKRCYELYNEVRNSGLSFSGPEVNSLKQGCANVRRDAIALSDAAGFTQRAARYRAIRFPWE